MSEASDLRLSLPPTEYITYSMDVKLMVLAELGPSIKHGYHYVIYMTHRSFFYDNRLFPIRTV